MIDIPRIWPLGRERQVRVKRSSFLDRWRERQWERIKAEAHAANLSRTRILEEIAELDRRNREGDISFDLWKETRDQNERARDYWNNCIAQCARTLGLSIEEAYAL